MPVHGFANNLFYDDVNPVWTTNTLTLTQDSPAKEDLVTRTELEYKLYELQRKIYNVLFELNKIDISEQEFLDLLGEQ